METRAQPLRRFITALVLCLLYGLPGAQGSEAPAENSIPNLDARLLRASFLDLLGRPPYEEERDRWAGAPLDELCDDVLAGEEFWRNWLEEQLYYFLLIDNFRPTSRRVLEAPEQLAKGRIGVVEALHAIVLSASFDRRNPGPDTFVTVVMEQLLDVEVQKRARELEIGKRVYDGARGKFLGKSGASQADVVRIAIEDDQALRHFIAREHVRLLRREPEPRDLSRWVRALDQDERAYAAIVKEWLLSEEYARRLASTSALPNRLFVRVLFVDLTDRLPDEGEARRLRNAMDGLADAGPLRSVVARLLLDSGQVVLPEREEITDPTAWVSALFERFFGRSPGAEELSVFVGAFHDPACRPATVVYAMVSHPEYQTW